MGRETISPNFGRRGTTKVVVKLTRSGGPKSYAITIPSAAAERMGWSSGPGRAVIEADVGQGEIWIRRDDALGPHQLSCSNGCATKRVTISAAIIKLTEGRRPEPCDGTKSIEVTWRVSREWFVAEWPTEGARKPNRFRTREAAIEHPERQQLEHPQLASLPDLLTMKEAASYLRLSTRSMYRAEERKEIKTVRIGGRVLVPKMSILSILEDDG